jgi:hypothetical protein
MMNLVLTGLLLVCWVCNYAFGLVTGYRYISCAQALFFVFWIALLQAAVGGIATLFVACPKMG